MTRVQVSNQTWGIPQPLPPLTIEPHWHPEILTLVTFSCAGRGTAPYTQFDRLPIKSVPKLTQDDYLPSGMTPLYDAIGVTVGRLGESPVGDKVIVVIMTDGEENSSREWSHAQVKALIDQRTRCPTSAVERRTTG
jgi:hypothetical protein